MQEGRRRTETEKDYNWSSSCLPLLRKASFALLLSLFFSSSFSRSLAQKSIGGAQKSLKELHWLPVSAPCSSSLQAAYFLSSFPPLWAFSKTKTKQNKRNQKEEKEKSMLKKERGLSDDRSPPSRPLLLGSCICHYFGSFDANASVI